MEVKARPAGAAIGGIGRRAITGGHTTTISPDLGCMRTGNTELHPGTACTCVPSTRGVFMLSRSVCGYAAAAAPATPAVTLGTHTLVPLHLLEHAAGCVRQSSLRMRAFCWHVCACDFVQPADRVIKHKVFCVCVFGLCFLYVLVYFAPGVTCWSGQTSKPRLFFATSWVFACTHAHTLGHDRM